MLLTPSRVCRWVATVGGIGSVPVAPGTAGSLAGLGLVLALGPDPVRVGLAILICAALGLATIPAAERALGEPDPRAIVIDEAVGMAIALWRVPLTWPLVVAAVALFRLFDILKPPPLRALGTLRTPWGVLLDDVGAGLLTNVLVLASVRWLS